MVRTKNVPVIAFYFLMLMIIYSIIGYINSYMFNLKGASKDAEYFVEIATDWAKYGDLGFYVNSEFYAQFLGIFFRIFGSTEFVAVQINIFALIIVGVLLNRLLKMQGVPFFNRLLCIFVIGFWPTMVPRAAAAMREPLLIMSFLWFYYEIVNIRYRPRIARYASLMAAAFLGFSLHKAGSILILVYLVLACFYWRRDRVKRVKKAIYLFVLILIIAGLVIMVRGSDLLGSVAGLRELNSILNLDSTTIAMIFDHKADISERASYGVIIDLSSPLSIFLSIPWVLLNYMLQPFPQNISNIYDVVAFLEVLCRVFMLTYLFQYRARLSKESRLLLLFYIAGCCLWSVGTTNWGTAQRHHLTTNWMLILVYVQHKYGFGYNLLRK